MRKGKGAHSGESLRGEEGAGREWTGKFRMSPPILSRMSPPILSVLAANIPRFSANKGLQISRAVDDSKNEDVVVFHEVDDSICSENHFSKIRTIKLGNNASDVGVREECLCELNNAIDERDRMEYGITGDEGFDVLKIVPGSQRPADLRRWAILSFSSAWVRTRPSSLS